MAVVPKILVTGFSVFPGTPVNPTELMVRELMQSRTAVADDHQLRADVLDVDFSTIGNQLAAIAEEFEPDIALHFGVAAEATGFRLERHGRNIAASDRPDNTGGTSSGTLVTNGADQYESTLPREEIAKELSAADLPVSLDDQVGDYLCNAAFYLSRSGTCGAFRPTMSGFIHVPQLPETEGGLPGDETTRLPQSDLVQGAKIAVRTCIYAWNEKRAAS